MSKRKLPQPKRIRAERKQRRFMALARARFGWLLSRNRLYLSLTDKDAKASFVESLMEFED